MLWREYRCPGGRVDESCAGAAIRGVACCGEGADGGPFAIGGRGERWHGEAGDVQSCSIVTTDANELMRPLHDCMPVIFGPMDYAAWLDQTPRPKAGFLSLLRAFSSEAMKAVPISTIVNNPRNQGPGCIAPRPKLVATPSPHILLTAVEDHHRSDRLHRCVP
jgi:hypothetical protein